MNSAIADNGKWGKEIDYNFCVADKAKREKFIKNGCDSNSINGNPLFVNPSKRDFSIQNNSVVLKIGFVNFPINQYGVKKSSLKAIAKTPALPDDLIDIKETALQDIKKNKLG